MLLVLDAGNSTICVGLWSGDWVGEWRLSTDRRRTADEHGVLFRWLLDRNGHSTGGIDDAVVCSVVPGMESVLADAIRLDFGVDPLVFRPGVRSGLEIVYDPPTSLGGDRLAAAVAARTRFGAPVVVVDFGTATTITVVDARGRLIGGAISSGVGTAADALARAGARLHRIALEPGDIPLIGRTTEQSMRSGALLGHAAAVEHLLTDIDRELGTAGGARATVVGTGGWSRTLGPLVSRIDHIEPRLVLDGLRLVRQIERV